MFGSLVDPPGVLSVPTCCSVVRPGSWYSIMLCSAVTVANLMEAGRRRRCVKLRGLSAFSSSCSSSPSPFSFLAATPVWLKMHRAVSGSQTRSMPLKKEGRKEHEWQEHRRTANRYRNEPLLPAVMKCSLGFFTPIWEKSWFAGRITAPSTACRERQHIQTWSCSVFPQITRFSSLSHALPHRLV